MEPTRGSGPQWYLTQDELEETPISIILDTGIVHLKWWGSHYKDEQRTAIPHYLQFLELREFDKDSEFEKRVVVAPGKGVFPLTEETQCGVVSKTTKNGRSFVTRPHGCYPSTFWDQKQNNQHIQDAYV